MLFCDWCHQWIALSQKISWLGTRPGVVCSPPWKTGDTDQAFLQYEYLVGFYESWEDEAVVCVSCWDLKLYLEAVACNQLLAGQLIRKSSLGFPVILEFLVVIIIVIVILVIGLSSSHSLEPKVLRKSSLGSELLAIDQTSAADCQWPAGTNVSLSIISRFLSIISRL